MPDASTMTVVGAPLVGVGTLNTPPLLLTVTVGTDCCEEAIVAATKLPA